MREYQQTQDNEQYEKHEPNQKRFYYEIIADISKLLNHKGRNKKGFDCSVELIKLLRELKTYKIVSTYFLKNLLNSDFTPRQKTQKIADLIRGLEKRFEEKYFREDEFVKYKKEILEYGYLKGKEPYKPVLKNVVVKIENSELPLANAEIDTGKKELIGYNVIVKNYRSVTIGKSFGKIHKKQFCFLEIE